MNLFFEAMDRFYAATEARIAGDVERRESGPPHLDKTSDEYYDAAAEEVTDERVADQDSLFGVLS